MLLTITPIIVGFTINCIMRSLGRKTIIQVGTFLVFIGHTLLAIGNYLKEGDSIPDVSKALVVLGFFIVVMSFGVSLGNVTFLYASEIVPNRFVNISILVSWVFATIVAIVIPILFSVIENLAPIFTFFAAWCLISFCLNCKLMV